MWKAWRKSDLSLRARQPSNQFIWLAWNIGRVTISEAECNSPIGNGIATLVLLRWGMDRTKHISSEQ